MVEHQQDVLRLQPDMIPALRASLSAPQSISSMQCAHQAQRAADTCRAPWLGDETSKEVAAHYTSRAMDEPDSSYQALSHTATNSHVSTTPSSAWRTSTVAATTTRPPTWGAGHERRALGGVLPRGDLLPRAAGARAARLRGRRGRVVHRREHHPHRRRPAHPRRQADRRGLAGPGRGGRAGRHDRDEQLGTRRRRRRVAHQERHQRAGRAGRPVAQRHAAPAHRGVEPDRAGGGARRRARVRDGRPRRARGTDGGRPRGGGRDDEPVLQPVVGQPAPDELLDAAADGRRRGRFGEVDHEHRSARCRRRRWSALGRRCAGR